MSDIEQVLRKELITFLIKELLEFLHHFHYPFLRTKPVQIICLKVLSSKMDQAEIRLIRQIFINGNVAEAF